MVIFPRGAVCFQSTIRGLKKMKLRCGLALSVMLAMALGRIQSIVQRKKLEGGDIAAFQNHVV